MVASGAKADSRDRPLVATSRRSIVGEARGSRLVVERFAKAALQRPFRDVPADPLKPPNPTKSAIRHSNRQPTW